MPAAPASVAPDPAVYASLALAIGSVDLAPVEYATQRHGRQLVVANIAPAPAVSAAPAPVVDTRAPAPAFVTRAPQSSTIPQSVVSAASATLTSS